MIKRCDWSPEKKMHNAAINEAADVSSALSNERLCSVLILAECETKDTHVHVPAVNSLSNGPLSSPVSQYVQSRNSKVSQ